MSNALSQDIRERFKRLMDMGHSAAESGRQLLLSRATAARWGHRVRSDLSLDVSSVSPRLGRGKLAPHMDFFIELIEEDPDITLVELRDALMDACGVSCHISSLDAALKRHGYTYKKRPDRPGTRSIGQ